MNITEMSKLLSKPEWWLYQLKCTQRPIYDAICDYGNNGCFYNGYVKLIDDFETYKNFSVSYAFYLEDTKGKHQIDMLLCLDADLQNDSLFCRALMINIRNSTFKTERTKLKYLDALKTIYGTFHNDAEYLKWLEFE